MDQLMTDHRINQAYMRQDMDRRLQEAAKARLIKSAEENHQKNSAPARHGVGLRLKYKLAIAAFIILTLGIWLAQLVHAAGGSAFGATFLIM